MRMLGTLFLLLQSLVIPAGSGYPHSTADPLLTNLSNYWDMQSAPSAGSYNYFVDSINSYNLYAVNGSNIIADPGSSPTRNGNSFSGTSNQVAAGGALGGSTPSLTLPAAWGVSTWVYGYTATGVIWGNQSGVGSGQGVSLSYTGGHVELNITTTAGNWLFENFQGINTNQETNIYVNYDGSATTGGVTMCVTVLGASSGCSLYVPTTGTITGTMSASVAFSVGGIWGPGVSQPVTTLIHDTRVYGNQISPTQITSILSGDR